MSLKSKVVASVCLCLPLFSPLAAWAKDKTIIAGTASVVDGDTLKFDGLSVRLWGIDAPETGQKCGKTKAGALAETAMRNVAQGHRAVCEVRDYDKKSKRPVAQCTVDGQDVAASLVEQGWAYPTAASNGAYSVERDRAKTSMKGVYILSCEQPAKWVHDQKRAEKKRLKKKQKLASRE